MATKLVFSNSPYVQRTYVGQPGLPRGPSEVQFVVQLLHFINVEWLTPTTSKCGHFEQIFFGEGNFIYVCLRICFSKMGRYWCFINWRLLRADATLPTVLLSCEKDWNEESVIGFPFTTQFNVLVYCLDIDSHFTRNNCMYTHNFAKHFKSNQIRNWNF